MIRKLRNNHGFRLESKKIDPLAQKHKNLGTFTTKAEAKKHEQAVEFFKRRK